MATIEVCKEGNIVIWRFIVRFVSAYLLVGLLLSWQQVSLIFPGTSLPVRSSFRDALLPHFDQFFVSTSDGEQIEMWTNLAPDVQPPIVALISHGNGETVESRSFTGFFRRLGIPSFIYDYRGFGRSSGSPSEGGILLDAEAALTEVHRRTGLPTENIVLLGNSLGGAPTAYLAAKHQFRAVILLAPFSSLRSVVARHPFYAPFLPFLRFSLPVLEPLSRSTSPCLVIAHGERDTVVPFREFLALQAALAHHPSTRWIVSSTAGHNDLYDAIEKQLVQVTSECLAPLPSASALLRAPFEGGAYQGQ